VAGPDRLVLVGPYPPPWGGISVHLRSLRALAGRAAIEAEILDVGEGHGARTGADRIHDGGSRLRFLSGLARTVRRGDAVHVHTSGNNAKAWLVALAASRPTVRADRRLLTVHSGLAPALLERSSRVRALARAAAQGYRRILCTNAGIAAALQACGIPRFQLQVVSPFLPADVEAKRAPPKARAARERHDPLLACALAPGRQYGRAILLDALAILAERTPGLGCLVFGSGTSGEELREAIEARRLEGKVIALGEIDHDEALGAIGLSDLFVRPTLADGDSLSVREALGLGVRVVASDAAPRPRGVVTFPTGRSEALASVVEAALRREPPRSHTGAEGESSALEAWGAIGLSTQGGKG